MADITLTCGQCGNLITVSEYVEADTLVCAKCQQTVPVPRRIPEASPAARLKLAAPPPPPSAPLPDEAAPKRRAPRLRRLRRRSRGIQPAVWGYVTFILLAAALVYLRFYPDAMPGDRREQLVTAAIAALGFLHVSVIAYAFADDAFHGVLCAIIPGYSVYYLYTQADQFLLRAVVGALLLAFGLDTLQFIRRFSYDVYVDVSSWIQDTDSLKKDRYPQIK
jgi:hypothetical protein